MGDKSRLVEIRDEYITLLVDAMAKPINDSLMKLVNWDDGKSVWQEFRKRLRSVRHWNSIKIKDEVDRIVLRCAHVRKLLTAVMCAFVRVYVHMHNDTPQINLEVPTLEKFVHTVFDNTAEFFYYNTTVWQDDDERRKVITRVIVRAVKRFLPMEDILQAFLGSGNSLTAAQDEDEEGPPAMEEAVPPQAYPFAPESVPVTDAVVPIAPVAVESVAPAIEPPPVAPQSPAPVPGNGGDVSVPAAETDNQPAQELPASPPDDAFFSDADDEL